MFARPRGRSPRRALPKIWHIPERGLVFVHVPKVATRSMRMALARPFADGSETAPAEVLDVAISRYERFATPRQILSLSRSCFTFGFVRDPLDRLLSTYRDKVLHGDGRNELCRRHRVARDTTFDEFVAVAASSSDTDCDRHLCSQHLFLCHRGRLAVSFVGHFERLDEDWTAIGTRFDLAPLPHRNRSRAPRDHAYTRDLIDVVAKRYRRDIELFGYRGAVDRALDEAGP